jgi:hypothetical protein
MLNRVRDFRYEDIKNWKPLVSLRESYRKESAVRNLILWAVCIFAILVGYSIISGTLQFTNKSAEQAKGSTADEDLGLLRPLKEQDDSGEKFPTRSSAFLVDGQGAQGNKTAPVNGTRGNHLPANYEEASSSTLVTTDAKSPQTTVRVPRIAICDVKRILASELAAYADQLVQTSEQQLAAEQKTVYENAAKLSEIELLLLQKLFEQKKELAVREIRERLQQYRELAEQNLRVIADAMAQEYDFELVITADHALSFPAANDITSVVQQEWALQRRTQAQLQQQNNFPRNR